MTFTNDPDETSKQPAQAASPLASSASQGDGEAPAAALSGDESTKPSEEDGMLPPKRASKWRSHLDFDYKEPTTLYRFLAPGGKIFPARVNKISQSQQRKYCRAVKKARHLALLPIGNFHYDSAGRPEPVSPKPISFK